jgi:hypothetical protein
VAFLRFTRDRRGYQHFYLVEPIANRRGKVRQRVLYWFRSPPDIKVGREPFDENIRRALEAQNPGVSFDWRAILEAPIPSADAEKWRERRRAERAAKQAIASSVPEDEDEGDDSPAIGEPGLESRDTQAPTAESASASTGESNRRKRRRRRGKRPAGASAAREMAPEPGAPDERPPLDEPDEPDTSEPADE